MMNARGTGVTLALYSLLVLVAALLVLWYWKENALYFVFVAAYVQNFLLAYLLAFPNRTLCGDSDGEGHDGTQGTIRPLGIILV
jgi:hypothetical protein